MSYAQTALDLQLIWRHVCLSQAFRLQPHLLKSQLLVQSPSNRCLWAWVNSMFNRVDNDRLKIVGPDRACAEWLLRCGAKVRWTGLEHWESDYNSLPKSHFDKYKISEIDASDSAVMGIGFHHLKGITHVKKIVLHNCGYLDDTAIELLPLVKDSLIELQISSCGDITPRSIPFITELQNLHKLVMFDLPEIRDKKSTLETLSSSLRKCQIDFRDGEERETDEK